LDIRSNTLGSVCYEKAFPLLSHRTSAVSGPGKYLLWLLFEDVFEVFYHVIGGDVIAD